MESTSFAFSKGMIMSSPSPFIQQTCLLDTSYLVFRLMSMHDVPLHCFFFLSTCIWPVLIYVRRKTKVWCCLYLLPHPVVEDQLQWPQCMMVMCFRRYSFQKSQEWFTTLSYFEYTFSLNVSARKHCFITYLQYWTPTNPRIIIYCTSTACLACFIVGNTLIPVVSESKCLIELCPSFREEKYKIRKFSLEPSKLEGFVWVCWWVGLAVWIFLPFINLL